MRIPFADLLLAFSFATSCATMGIALAVPPLTPCGEPCKEIYLKYDCSTTNVAVMSKSDCDACQKNGCTVGGNFPNVACAASDTMDVDVYADGIVACRACTPQDVYVEASHYEGNTIILSTQGTRRFTCGLVAIGDYNPPGGELIP